METERLRLRPVVTADATRMVELITPEVSRWSSSWRGRIRLKICSRGSHEHMPPSPKEERAELGYWLGEAYQGKGYATEAVAAIVPAAFDTLGIKVIQAGAQPEHRASFRVMRKLGMQPIGEKKVWSTARNREEVCLYFELRRQH